MRSHLAQETSSICLLTLSALTTTLRLTSATVLPAAISKNWKYAEWYAGLIVFQAWADFDQYLEEVHGKVSLPLACNMLQRLRFHIREKDLKAVLALSAELKDLLVAMQQIPIELLVVYLFFSVWSTVLLAGIGTHLS